MSWEGVRQASVILEVVGVVLLLALLITPAPKHAIVNALTVATILRSVCAVIPSVAYQRHREEFDHIMMHPNLSNFCVGFAIVLRYLTVVKAAFTVSFTSPLLWLAVQHSRYTGFESSSSSAFYKGTVGILCIAPFVWALPTLFAALPDIVNNPESLKPMFYEATCTISNTPYQVVSLSLMISALLFATIISIAFVYIMWRHVRLPLLSRSLGVLDITRILRFGALLGIIVLSAVLYTTVMATWARDHVSRFSPRPMNTVFTLSVLWEAATPILMFVIFGAQEEVFEVWISWYTSLRRGPLRSDSPSSRFTKDESYLDFAPTPGRRSFWSFFKRSPTPVAARVIVDVKQESISDRSVESLTEGLPKRSSMQQVSTRYPIHVQTSRTATVVHTRPPPSYRRSSQTHRYSVSMAHNSSGLRPPPRPTRSRSESPGDSLSIRHPYAQMPSLTAFGSRDSFWPETAEATLFANPDAAITSDRDVESAVDDNTARSKSQSPDAVQRPGTGETSDTFGEHA